MTAKIQIRSPEARTVAMSSLCLGDFFSFPTADDRAYVVVELDGARTQMRYSEIGTDRMARSIGSEDLDMRVNKLRLTAAFFELDVQP